MREVATKLDSRAVPLAAVGIKALIIDDHPGLGRALALAMRFDGRLEPLGPLPSLSAGLRMLDEADVVALDLSLGDATGLSGIEAIRAARPELPIVVYSGAPEAELEAAAELADAAIRKGAVNRLFEALVCAVERSARPVEQVAA